ncbi:uncharacterized protein V6R79_003069 [Siganus canaliculatus]
MMESYLSNKVDRPDQMTPEADDLKRHLSSDFSSLPDPQHSSAEEKEHLQVYLRIRPFSPAELENGESQDCVTIEPPDTVLLKPPSLSLSSRLSADRSFTQTGQRFQFSQVHGPETTQRQLFQGTVKDLVKDVLEGGNSLVFTYGVTNAGKTFTFLGPDADAGILPRSLHVIFSSIEEQVFTGSSIKPHRCQESTRLSMEQQTEEALFKRNLFRQLKENEKSNVSLLNSTNKTLLEDSCVLSTAVAAAEEDKISLEVEAHTKFSVWVSFCEIYNENIHDLLEVFPGGALRRTALRLSQDVKGNAFVKDLRWVQVSNAEEAYKVMKVGKRNQSFSSTRLNQLSSRSHSIFSIRILKIEDIGTPRVLTVSELSLCDLAGSERCAKTQNKGERLKEAGNINTSLLILGKCINALRHNQQAKLLQHVPFRESKLTHYLQGFFCGRGKACMIVNINQCASMYDETLNVLKFSAVAQKVVVLSTRLLPILSQRSTSEAAFMLNNAERKALRGSRRSSLNGWDSSLEDVQEDEVDECEEEQDETMDQSDNDEGNDEKVLISKRLHQRQTSLLKQLQVQLKKEQAESLLLEARVREEISREFSELFSEMQSDYNERLVREREILEERAERRMEIFKNLTDKMASAGPSADPLALDTSLDSCSSELAMIKKAAEAAHKCLCSGRAGAQGEQRDAVEKLERTVLELTEHQRKVREQMAHSRNAEAGGDKTRPGPKLRDKSSLAASPQKEAAERRSQAEEEDSSEKQQLQEVLALLEKEKKSREDALVALQYQTTQKEETLVALDEERRAREEALATIAELRRSKEVVSESLSEERSSLQKTTAALEAERKAREDAVSAFEKEKQSKEQILAALATETSGKEETRLVLEVQEEEISRLKEERHKESEMLQEQVKELKDKLEATERQASSEMDRAEHALLQLHKVQAQLEKHQGEAAQIHDGDLVQKQEDPASSEGRLREGTPEHRQVLELEQELVKTKEELKHFTEKLNQQEAASQQRVEELRQKLQEQEELSQQQLDELRSKLENQERVSKEQDQHLREKLEQQIQTSAKQVEELREKLQEQEVVSQQQVEELKLQLSQQKAASDKLVEELQLKMSDQEQSTELLKAQVEEAKAQGSSRSAEEDLQRLNADLQSEVAALRAKLSTMEAVKESTAAEEVMLKEKLAELQQSSAQAEAELQKKLVEKEAQVSSLQKSLQQAEERQQEEESQAVQEARRREVERRRELLAVAHEAIAQKDGELEKKAEEISRLKENAKQDSDKARSLGLDLQRKEDEAADLREKLADYKKQIQQVQKEISTMREEEKVSRRKLCDLEKDKKQLQSDLAVRDRTIQQLKAEPSSDCKSEQMLQLYQKACNDLEAQQRVVEDMRLALTEQEETQSEMEKVLEEKLNLVDELCAEREKLRGMVLQQDGGANTQHHAGCPSDDLQTARKEAARAQESLKLCTEKHQAEREKWQEEKLLLIGHAKEAEDKRNQEMRKFMKDRERYTQQQGQLESLSSQLAEKDQTMEKWRKERDTLVAALEVQLQKLLSSQAEKDKLIQQLRHSDAEQPPETAGDGGDAVAQLQAALSEKEAETQRLKEELRAASAKLEDVVSQTKSNESPATLAGKPQTETINRKSGGRRDTRASVSSQSSSGFPSVLESSEISTENGRTSRFPRPELEISFSPLQPNRMALRRQGEENAVTVKITRSTRKRKSGEMEKDEVEAQNRRNTRTKLTPKITPHQEETSSSSSVGHQNSQSSVRSRKEGTLQKIGEFLQSSPTLLGSKAKKMMSLVSGRGDADSAPAAASSSSLSLRAKKSKRKLYRPEISSPLDMPSHPIISRDPEEKESDHQIIKRRLRSRLVK